MSRVLILGAGGHGLVVADALLRAAAALSGVEPIGYLDDNPALAGRVLLGLPVLGPIASLGQVEADAVVVALGGNALRRQVFESLQAKGVVFQAVRHPSAVVAPDVALGEGCMIIAGAVVNPGTKVGSNVILNTACSIDHHNILGDHCHIAPGVRLGGDVAVGEEALVGIGAVVLPGVRIGARAVVGAGAVVLDDIPEDVVACGLPARVLRRRRDRDRGKERR